MYISLYILQDGFGVFFFFLMFHFVQLLFICGIYVRRICALILEIESIHRLFGWLLICMHCVFSLGVGVYVFVTSVKCSLKNAYPCGRYNWSNLKIHYDEQHCQRAVRSIALDMGTGCCGSQQCSVSGKRIIRTSVMPLIAWLLAATGCAIFLSHRTPHAGAGLMAVVHILLLVCIVYTCVLKPSFIWSNIWTNLEKFCGKYKLYQTWSNVNSYFPVQTTIRCMS